MVHHSKLGRRWQRWVINAISGALGDLPLYSRQRPLSEHLSSAVQCNRRHQGDLFNDLVGYCENVGWQIEAKRFRSFEIDHQFELGYSQHW